MLRYGYVMILCINFSTKGQYLPPGNDLKHFLSL